MVFMGMVDNEWFREQYLERFGPCNCYECAESKLDENGSVINNMKRHTFLESCQKCGRAKTEYRDLGTKGLYVCWWCEKRVGEYL